MDDTYFRSPRNPRDFEGLSDKTLVALSTITDTISDWGTTDPEESPGMAEVTTAYHEGLTIYFEEHGDDITTIDPLAGPDMMLSFKAVNPDDAMHRALLKWFDTIGVCTESLTAVDAVDIINLATEIDRPETFDAGAHTRMSRDERLLRFAAIDGMLETERNALSQSLSPVPTPSQSPPVSPLYSSQVTTALRDLTEE